MIKKLLSKEFLQYASVPLLLLLGLLVLFATYQILNLPPRAVIIEMAGEYYERYGYTVLFLAAVAEGALVINWYVPGTTIIILGLTLAQQSDMRAALSIMLVIAGFYGSSIFNYLLGRYGGYRLLLKFGLKQPLEKIQAKTEKAGLPIIFSTYFHPNVGAVFAASAGILRFPFGRFALYSLAALVVWNTFWGTLIYLAGPFVLQIVGPRSLLVLLLGWVVYLAVGFLKKGDHKPPAQIP